MSDIDTTTGLETTDAQGGTNRKAKAKQAVNQASEALRQEAQSFATAAQEKARAEAQRRAQTATKTLGDFANAVRRAGDDLAEHDQSLGAQLVRQAADGLETLSRNLADKEPEDLLNAVRDFGRRNPAAFIGGAVLVGVALGRFVRASDTIGDDADLTGEVGGAAYPIAETAAYATPAQATGEEALGLAEEQAFEGDAEFGGSARAGIQGGVADDLGDLTPSEVEDSTSVLGVDDQTAPERRGT